MKKRKCLDCHKLSHWPKSQMFCNKCEAIIAANEAAYRACNHKHDWVPAPEACWEMKGHECTRCHVWTPSDLSLYERK